MLNIPLWILVPFLQPSNKQKPSSTHQSQRYSSLPYNQAKSILSFQPLQNGSLLLLLRAARARAPDGNLQPLAMSLSRWIKHSSSVDLLLVVAHLTAVSRVAFPSFSRRFTSSSCCICTNVEGSSVWACFAYPEPCRTGEYYTAQST